ncbi:hypothetical protein JTE90_024650, partial [Oedothorax gibbosus]
DNTDGETSEDEFELLEPKCKDYTSELESDTKNWERVKTRRGDVYYLPKIRDKSIRLRNTNDVSKYCSDNNIEFNPEDFDFGDKSVNYMARSETTSTDSDPEINLVEVKIPNSFEESLTSPERHEWVKAMKIELSAPHFSIVLLAVVDANYQFVVADVGSKGRFSDGGIFATNALGHHFRNRTLGILEDRSICDGGSPMPHVFVADEAFPLQRHLMRPFPGTQLDDIKRIFNYRLSRARRIVENDRLWKIFRVYRRPFECKLETVDKVVKATVVLHNYLGRTGGHNYSDEDISKAMQETDNQLLNLPRIENNPSSEAFLVRDMFCNYFMNVGQVKSLVHSKP